MQHIDEKFKEISPEKTVEKIRDILSSLGINIVENGTIPASTTAVA